jgi:hypothetical protein
VTTSPSPSRQQNEVRAAGANAVAEVASDKSGLPGGQRENSHHRKTPTPQTRMLTAPAHPPSTAKSRQTPAGFYDPAARPDYPVGLATGGCTAQRTDTGLVGQPVPAGARR